MPVPMSPVPRRHDRDWTRFRRARSASEPGPDPFARSLGRDRVAVALLSTTRFGDHLCQHSAQVADHPDPAAPSVPAPVDERRTSRLPQRGQTSPMADEITSRSRTVRPFSRRIPDSFRIRADYRSCAPVDLRKFEARNAGPTSGTHIGQLLEDPVIDDVGELARSRAHG